MGQLFVDNFWGFLGFLIMLSSVILQMTYLKFKRTCEEINAEVKSKKFYKFFSLFKVEFQVDNQPLHAYVYKFSKEKLEQNSIPLLINRKFISEREKSIVLIPLLKKLKLVQDNRVYAMVEDYSPIILYSFLMVIGIILVLL